MKYNLAFTPGGAQVAYTVLQLPNWATYTVSVLGGDSHLFFNNAAGLTWLDQHQLLFSRTRPGQHMGIVTGTATGQEFREVYFPPHERAMAHYCWASPDHQSALVVEMNERGGWAPCRLISLDGRFDPRSVGLEAHADPRVGPAMGRGCISRLQWTDTATSGASVLRAERRS